MCRGMAVEDVLSDCDPKAARPARSCAACPGRPQDIDVPVAEMAVQL
jgi:hypothetical protein